jgi:hypothetical protein
MIRRFLFLCALLFCRQLAFTQHAIRGKVISEESGSPIPSVSVYLNNTSIGAISNEKGAFEISNIPAGKFRLIASSVGYETYVKQIDPREISDREMIISLKPKAEELQGFAVLPPEPDGWKKYGKIFTDIFIGTVPMRSNNCKLVNPEVIKFRLDEKTNIMTAFASEPLLISNYSLGYEIRYKLEEFEYDFNTQLVNYSGYALFKDMALEHSNRTKRYTEERLDSYRGSLLHFMRSFYLNNLEAQGFEMRSLGNISNPEKDRAKMKFSINKNGPILDTSASQVGYEIGTDGVPAHLRSTLQIIDSTDYFKKKMLEPDSVISHQLISSDSIGFAADSSIAGLYFKDSLEVSYKLKEIPARYRVLSKEHRHEVYPVSQFVFVYKRPVYVLVNGYYYKPYDLKITGYWAWAETMSTRLPYDYDPAKK